MDYKMLKNRSFANCVQSKCDQVRKFIEQCRRLITRSPTLQIRALTKATRCLGSFSKSGAGGQGLLQLIRRCFVAAPMKLSQQATLLTSRQK